MKVISGIDGIVHQSAEFMAVDATPFMRMLCYHAHFSSGQLYTTEFISSQKQDYFVTMFTNAGLRVEIAPKEIHISHFVVGLDNGEFDKKKHRKVGFVVHERGSYQVTPEVRRAYHACKVHITERLPVFNYGTIPVSHFRKVPVDIPLTVPESFKGVLPAFDVKMLALDTEDGVVRFFRKDYIITQALSVQLAATQKNLSHIIADEYLIPQRHADVVVQHNRPYNWLAHAYAKTLIGMRPKTKKN